MHLFDINLKFKPDVSLSNKLFDTLNHLPVLVASHAVKLPCEAWN